MVDAYADLRAVPTVEAAPDAVDPMADAALDAVAPKLDAVAPKLEGGALGGANDAGAEATGTLKDEGAAEGNDGSCGG